MSNGQAEKELIVEEGLAKVRKVEEGSLLYRGTPVADAKKNGYLPDFGTPVKTRVKTAETFAGLGIPQDALDARQDGLGVYVGWVGGAGGDVVKVKHPDGRVAPYWQDEMDDVPEGE